MIYASRRRVRALASEMTNRRRGERESCAINYCRRARVVINGRGTKRGFRKKKYIEIPGARAFRGEESLSSVILNVRISSRRSRCYRGRARETDRRGPVTDGVAGTVSVSSDFCRRETDSHETDAPRWKRRLSAGTRSRSLQTLLLSSSLLSFVAAVALHYALARGRVWQKRHG